MLFENYLNIPKGKSPRSIQIPGSKSYINRALILASMKNEKVTIDNVNYCDDVINLIEALKSVGLNINILDENKVEVINSFPRSEIETSKILIGEGGTSFRFFLSLLCLGSKPHEIELSSSLKKRPHDELITTLRFLGVNIEEKEYGFRVQGPITFKDCTIDCSNSSQYASALILLTFKKDFKIHLKNHSTSFSYVEMTKKLVEDAKTNSVLKSPGDFSSASYFIAQAIVLNEEIELVGMVDDVFQSDRKILNVLEQIGVLFDFVNNSLKILKPNLKLKPFSQDISDCLDLAPTLAFLASFIEGESKLLNITNLRYKESDRIESILSVLSHFKVNYQLIGNELCITGGVGNYANHIDLPNDHRIVMMASLFMRVLNGGEISSFNAVKKSYPNFFKELLFDC